MIRGKFKGGSERRFGRGAGERPGKPSLISHLRADERTGGRGGLDVFFLTAGRPIIFRESSPHPLESFPVAATASRGGTGWTAGTANLDLSDSGSVVYVSGSAPGALGEGFVLVWADREGNEEPLDLPAATYARPKLSPDGTRLAIGIGEQGQYSLWVYDLATSRGLRLTQEGSVFQLVWTPDGERIAFSRFANGNRDLYDVTFDVLPGEVVALAGRNGAGKTTLLRVASRVLTPSAGRVAIAGRPLTELSRRDLAQKLAVVPQDTPISFPFRAGEVVLMGRSPHLGVLCFESRTDIAVAREAMERVGIEEFADRSILDLSGGERQLVLIARAFAQDPHTSMPANRRKESTG